MSGNDEEIEFLRLSDDGTTRLVSVKVRRAPALEPKEPAKVSIKVREAGQGCQARSGVNTGSTA